MTELLNLELEGHILKLRRLQSSLDELRLDDKVVSLNLRREWHGVHAFHLPGHGTVTLEYSLDNTARNCNYRILSGQQVLAEGQSVITGELNPFNATESKSSSHNVESKATDAVKNHGIALFGLFFKLIKSAGALKAALAGTALAGWAWLFNLEVAICIIAALFIHEFGHVMAMRQCGLKVKGIYLIPFLGGAAVSEQAKTRWQDYKISMAGPIVGGAGAVAGWLAWLLTGNQTLAIFAAVSLLLNIFNLLPIVPLDGGQAIKAIAYSKPGKLGHIIMLALSAVLVAGAAAFGFTLLVFFGILGAVDLLASGSKEYQRQVPMNTYGMTVCAGLYFFVVSVLVAISWAMAGSGIAGANLPFVFLSS
ncbi:metalloprotease [Gilvimarinus sp. DA14]|uniref:metalloprotease n=1 Tax=Gilvimarinus sp. DA14 TaxID=2956798 RepID=UPI0020B8F8C0|nr:site-2 protease family protein [Gilvimarinus sp. DA14]UTF60465.1 site-2 protease family protein [Gilvimarinus sp. DA14]